MHFVLVPTGSAGDVNPFLGLGRSMLSRGHDVTIVTAEPFESAVKAIGAEFVSHQGSEDYNRVVDNPDLWDPLKGLGVLFSDMGTLMDTGLAALESACRDESFLVGHTLAFHARAFEELTGQPSVTIHLAPAAFRSNNVLPGPIPGVDFGSLPVWTKRLLWRFIDRFLDRIALRQINPWRKKKGLAPVSRLFMSWLHSPRGTIGLFPEWFTPRQPDWEGKPHLTGFVMYDQAPGWTPNPDLRAFLDAGEPPIMFTHGSANRHARDFYATAVEAATSIGRRAVLVTSFAKLVPDPLPPTVRHETYVPFSKLLPECAAIVHHGGIGTSAQGLAAGIPQLICPLGFDQPDNGTQLIRLGVANWISVARLTPARLATRLNSLLDNPQVAERCQHWANRMRATSPIDETVDWIEKLAVEGPKTPFDSMPPR